MKNDVYRTKPDTRDELLDLIMDVIARMKEGQDALRRAKRHVLTRVAKYIDAEGGTFEKIFLLNNQTDALIIQIYSVIKLYMFRASSLPFMRCFLLYIRHWSVSCRFLTTAFKQSQDVPS